MHDQNWIRPAHCSMLYSLQGPSCLCQAVQNAFRYRSIFSIIICMKRTAVQIEGCMLEDLPWVIRRRSWKLTYLHFSHPYKSTTVYSVSMMYHIFLYNSYSFNVIFIYFSLRILVFHFRMQTECVVIYWDDKHVWLSNNEFL
jgi:hypothetical protein